MKLLPLVLTASLFAPELGLAQYSVPEGSRVRVRQPPGMVWVGTLRSLSPDTVVFTDAKGQQFSLARQNIELERSIGRTQSFWKNFGLTVGSAAVIGGLVSAVSWTECNEDALGCLFEPGSRGGAFGYGVVAGGLVGVPLGVLLGAVIRREEWVKIGLQP